MCKKICIIDGQGGGIGATLIKYLFDPSNTHIELIALGTNAIATTQMLKAGANKGASGESAICKTLATADYILGPVAVSWPNAMLGEVTAKIAESVTSSPAFKIFIPLSQENILIIGINTEPLPHLVQEAVDKIKEEIQNV